MFCKYCGKELNDDSIFCNFCGNKVMGKNKELTKVKIQDNNENEIDSSKKINYESEQLVKRAFDLISDRNFDEAKIKLESALDKNPENGKAYVGLLLVKGCINNIDFLKDYKTPIEKAYEQYYKYIVKYNNDDICNKIIEINNQIIQNNKKEDIELAKETKKEIKEISKRIINGEKFVFFGKYPQTYIENTDLIPNKVFNLVNDKNNLNKFGNIKYNGEEFREFYNKYFKVEPIKWRVLNINSNNGVIYLLSEYVLFVQDVNYIDKDYYKSILKDYLTWFKNEAFDISEQKYLCSKDSTEEQVFNLPKDDVDIFIKKDNLDNKKTDYCMKLDEEDHRYYDYVKKDYSYFKTHALILGPICDELYFYSNGGVYTAKNGKHQYCFRPCILLKIDELKNNGNIKNSQVSNKTVKTRKTVSYDNKDIKNSQVNNETVKTKKTVRYSDGDVYEGEWKDGFKNGYGKYTWKSGKVYIGNWMNDKITGKGKIFYENGDVYEGDWKDGWEYGYGKYTWKSGKVYEGYYVNNISEKGKLICTNGDIYEGDWKDGKMNGYGKCTYKNGKVREIKSVFGGVKKFTEKYYEGNWQNGEFSGNGKLIFTDDSYWEGEFKNGDFIEGYKYTRTESTSRPYKRKHFSIKK